MSAEAYLQSAADAEDRLIQSLYNRRATRSPAPRNYADNVAATFPPIRDQMPSQITESTPTLATRRRFESCPSPATLFPPIGRPRSLSATPPAECRDDAMKSPSATIQISLPWISDSIMRMKSWKKRATKHETPTLTVDDHDDPLVMGSLKRSDEIPHTPCIRLHTSEKVGSMPSARFIQQVSSTSSIVLTPRDIDTMRAALSLRRCACSHYTCLCSLCDSRICRIDANS